MLSTNFTFIFIRKFPSLREPYSNCECLQNYQNHCIQPMKYCSDTALWNPNSTSYENCPRLIEIHLKRRNAAESILFIFNFNVVRPFHSSNI